MRSLSIGARPKKIHHILWVFSGKNVSKCLWLLLLLKLLLFPLRWGSLPSQKTLTHWLPFSNQLPQKSATPLLTQQRSSRGSTLPPLSGYNDEPRTLQWGSLREGQVESWDFHPYRAVMIPPPTMVSAEWTLDLQPHSAVEGAFPSPLWGGIRGGLMESGLSPAPWWQGHSLLGVSRGFTGSGTPTSTYLWVFWSAPHYKATVIKTVVLTFRQQNRSESGNKHKHQWPTDLGREYQSHSKGLSTVFSKNGVGWPDNHVGNKEAGTRHLPPYIKMNSTWINHLNITAKTKQLGENAGAKLNNLGFSNGFLNMMSEAKAVT